MEQLQEARRYKFSVKSYIYQDPNEYTDIEEVIIVFEDLLTGRVKPVVYNDILFFHTTNRISTKRSKANYMASLLNYIFIIHKEKYKIKEIGQLTLDMVDDYIRDIETGKYGKEKKAKDTINRIKSHARNFLLLLIKKGVVKKISKTNVEEDYLLEETAAETYTTVDAFGTNKMLLNMILDVCERLYPRYKFAILLQLYTGLRSGEICNMTSTRFDFYKENNIILGASINLLNKVRMRDDGVYVGGIKRYRMQSVHNLYVTRLHYAYEDHKELMDGCQNDFDAIFLNSKGKAMTRDNYYYAFSRIISEVGKKLQNMSSAEAASSLNILNTFRISTHSLRYTFSQNLVNECGIKDDVELAYYRGTKNTGTENKYIAKAEMFRDAITPANDSVLKPKRR